MKNIIIICFCVILLIAILFVGGTYLCLNLIVGKNFYEASNIDILFASSIGLCFEMIIMLILRLIVEITILK